MSCYLAPGRAQWQSLRPPEIRSERIGGAFPLIGMTTTPAMRRFLIIFSIVEAAMIAWAFVAPHIR